MEVLRSADADEVPVITRWQDQESFDAWAASEEFCTLPAKVPQITVTSVK